jgi:CPA2 family monovalent cation:H+ antiporter-2
MNQPLLHIVLLLTVALFLVALARRFRLPSLLAYLTVGMAVGPYGLGLIAENETTSGFAEFGVVFLMFSIGLEFSIARLRAMRRLVFGLGGAQLLLTLLGTALMTMFFYGNEWRVGVAVGGAVAMSSTAIVGKLLSERLELHSHAGRQTMAVLLFQDLAVVPLLILIPALAAPADGLLGALGVAFGQAFLVLGVLVFIGQKLMRRWFEAVVQERSREVFMLNVLWIVVGLAYLTSLAGLSLALGAFIGGMLISETLYRHQVQADIRPFRDILLGLFFVTIGMLLDFGYVFGHLGGVALALLLLILGKGGVVLLLTSLMRNGRETALRTAMQLAQGGEFGFVLLERGGDFKLIPEAVFQLTMAAMLLSMFVAPLLINHAGAIGRRLIRQPAGKASGPLQPLLQQVAAHGEGLREHVILCGFGRTGQNLAHFLDQEGIPFIALDLDPTRVSQAQKSGANVVFGDADRREVLLAAGLARARVLVVTYIDLPATEKVLHCVRTLRHDLPVIVRAADDSCRQHLQQLGAAEVVPEVLEGSLMLALQALTRLGVPVERAMAQVRTVRGERYSVLRRFYAGEEAHLEEQKKVAPAAGNDGGEPKAGRSD